MRPTSAQPSRAVLVACAGAGVVGAATLPLWRVGVGWLATALVVAVAAAVARSGRDGRDERDERDGGGAGPQPHGDPDRLWRVAAAVAGLALISVAAVRAAPWLVALCLGTGAALGSYAIVGGRTWRELAGGVFALVPASTPAVAWAVAGTRPGRSASGPSLLPRVIGGLLAGSLLLIVFGALLVSADPAFADLLRGWRQRVSPAEIARVLIGLTLGALVAVASAYLAATRRPPTAPEQSSAGPRASLGVVEWGIPVAMLDVLFAIFVFVQFTKLFGGDEYVLGPGGPDYAAYARGGFIQLLAVTVLTLVIVMVLAGWARRETAGQRMAIRVLVGTLCLLTLVIVAATLKRLGLYAQAYGFTTPRLLGYATAVWLGSVFALVIAAGVRLRARWLPRTVVATGVGVLIALAAVNPEGLMARTHIARLDQEYPLDYAFLHSLSADAVAELATLPEDLSWCAGYRNDIARSLAGADPWYAWNLSREHAREIVAGLSQRCGSTSN